MGCDPILNKTLHRAVQRLRLGGRLRVAGARQCQHRRPGHASRLRPKTPWACVAHARACWFVLQWSRPIQLAPACSLSRAGQSLTDISLSPAESQIRSTSLCTSWLVRGSMLAFCSRSNFRFMLTFRSRPSHTNVQTDLANVSAFRQIFRLRKVHESR